MSTKENIQEEEIKDSENNPQVNENQDIDEVKPTSEELIQQEKDKYLRLFAEFENYKKRTSKERIELFKTASQELMTSLLPIMDDFDRGLTEIKIAKHRNGSLDTIQLRANLSIQKFEIWDSDNSNGFKAPGGNWKAVPPTTSTPGGQPNAGGKFFVQGSKMNEGDFDAGFEEQPF